MAALPFGCTLRHLGSASLAPLVMFCFECDPLAEPRAPICMSLAVPTQTVASPAAGHLQNYKAKTEAEGMGTDSAGLWNPTEPSVF